MRPSFLAGILLAAALASPSFAVTNDDPVGGTWLVKGHLGTFAFTQTCQFERHGETLGGICYDAGGNKPHPLTAGSVSDDKIGWTFRSSFLLKTFDVTFSGVRGDTDIKGSIEAYGHTGAFTATRP